ncbi:hypothetical protein A2Z53_02640 [Candidatus Giovannonibacteria bacterium RIFCSPHIGHO2_02_42_15]|uniref:Zinc-binding domain-containing protein n=2 Tax=Candidatus Giovannoniibacteriota TaxID=1752738 RepID=A0A1F5VP93_9BACT|nr:MAG: hypothetical protein UV11_C0015G0006 [Candidatus Giovannonibacteria bacterium GW2011_GWF2_42_19]OGF65252.1 MAG: hypothetical protein A2Z53_02640 [Candidatus Giovannonibacteria bacterium RIFCSPHIGHO2_02_42_15]
MNEIRKCQNCNKDFTIEPEDFKFYEKMHVPSPTFCPECRFQRRLMFRNERALYKDKCDLCGKDMISVFSPDKPFKVYCSPCWWSDNWDPLESGQAYDPGRNFFEQMKEVMLKAPFQNLIVAYASLVDSDYVNHAGSLKNCYLIYNFDYCENVHYSEEGQYAKDLMDSTMISQSELCYEVINGFKIHNAFYSEDSTDSLVIYFSKNLSGCSNCLGCINLKNKKYHIFNQPYSKEEYENKLKDFNLYSYKSIQDMKKKVYEFWETVPQKFMHERHNADVSGDYVYESKNAHEMYKVRYVEDGKFCQIITSNSAKDVYDYTEWGMDAEKIIESITAGLQVSQIKFSSGVWNSCINIEYGVYNISSSSTFGCINIKKKQYCVLNKQYSKEEYEKLRAKIMEDLEKNPYIDSKGRVFKYGEFLPYDLSPYDYNESTASWYFPQSKGEVLKNGWRWHEEIPSAYKPTMKAEQMPDSIHDVKDDIVNEIFECIDCKKAWRVIKPEIDLLRRFDLPLPRKCPNCRYKERFSRINPPKLWDRTCAKCGKAIKTSYVPERSEVIYCSECYQQEFI